MSEDDDPALDKQFDLARRKLIESLADATLMRVGAVVACLMPDASLEYLGMLSTRIDNLHSSVESTIKVADGEEPPPKNGVH